MEAVNKKVIILSLIMALLTAGLVYIYIQKATVKTEVVQYINVYVAAKTLPPKHKITNSDIKVVQVTREYLNSKAVLNSADIVGKYLVDSVIEGEQILKDRLVDESKKTLAYKIPEGKRAVSVNINEQIQVGNLIKPGDFVDVIVSTDKTEEDGKVFKIVHPQKSKIVLQNIKVLAIGQEMYTVDEKSKEPPKTVTLEVDPAEAERLTLITEFGVIRLALRGVGDDKTTNTQGAIVNDILDNRGDKIVEK